MNVDEKVNATRPRSKASQAEKQVNPVCATPCTGPELVGGPTHGLATAIDLGAAALKGMTGTERASLESARSFEEDRVVCACQPR